MTKLQFIQKGAWALVSHLELSPKEKSELFEGLVYQLSLSQSVVLDPSGDMHFTNAARSIVRSHLAPLGCDETLPDTDLRTTCTACGHRDREGVRECACGASMRSADRIHP